MEFGEKIGFWQSSCLILPFLVNNGFSLKTVVQCTLAGCYKIAFKATDIFKVIRCIPVVSLPGQFKLASLCISLNVFQPAARIRAVQLSS